MTQIENTPPYCRGLSSGCDFTWSWVLFQKSVKSVKMSLWINSHVKINMWIFWISCKIQPLELSIKTWTTHKDHTTHHQQVRSKGPVWVVAPWLRPVRSSSRFVTYAQLSQKTGEVSCALPVCLMRSTVRDPPTLTPDAFWLEAVMRTNGDYHVTASSL